MGVSAKFEADFSSFKNAVDSAVVKLRDFEDNSSKVTAALTKMGNSFSGTKIISDATLMAKAVADAGGASTLTAREMAKVNDTVNEAIAKYTALGGKAPKAMMDLADATKQAEVPTAGLTTKMIAAGAAVGTFVGHLAAAGFSKFVSGVGDAIGSAFKMNASLETTTLKFTTLMGDSDKAGQHVKDLFEIAKKTPFETGPIIEASLKLQTFGGAALNTKANILLLGDASAATGAPINELGMWTGRLYAMLQAGKPFGEAAMRLQELAVLTPQARDKMEALQKSGASATEIFDVFKDSLGKFGGAMMEQAGTWEGVVSTFSDTATMLVANVLKPYFEVIRDLGREVNNALDGMDASFTSIIPSANDAKAAFIGFVNNGLNSTISALSFVMVEFNAAQVVFRDVSQIVSGVALAFEYAALGVAKLLNVASFGKAFSDDIKRINENIDSLLISMTKRGAAIQQDKAAEQDWIEWGKKATASVDDLTKRVAASAPTIEKHTRSVEGNSAAAKTLTASQKTLAKAVEEYGSVAGRVTDQLSGDTIEGIKWDLQRGISQGVLAKTYRVTSEQVAAVSDIMKQETASAKVLAEIHNKVEAATIGLNKGFGELDETELRNVKTHLSIVAGLKMVEQSVQGPVAGFYTMAKGLEEIGLKSTEIDVLKRRFAETDRQTKIFTDSITTLANDLVQMSQIAGDSFSPVLKSVGEGVKAFQMLTNAADAFRKATSEGGGGLNAANFTAMAASIATAAVAFYSLISSMAEAAGQARKLAALEVFGKTVAAQFGSTTKFSQGLSSALADLHDDVIGLNTADVSKLVAGFLGLDNTIAHTAEENARILQAWSDLSGKIPEALKLPDIIRELGGAAALTATQVGTVKDRVALLTQTMELGGVIGQQAFQSLQALTSEFVPSLDQVTEAASRLGLTIDDLGTKGQQLRLNDEAAAAVAAFGTLQKAGIDTGIVFDKMSVEARASFQSMATEALRAGLTIPDGMKPIFQGLLETTGLTDEFGNKLEDLSRFNFAKPMEQMVSDLIAALDRLVDKFETVGHTTVQAIHVPVVYDDPGYRATTSPGPVVPIPGASTGGFVSATGIQHFAGGGTVLNFRARGSDTVPAMLTPGETVLTPAQLARVMRGGGGEHTAALVAAMDRMEASQRRRDVFLKEIIEKAVKSAVQRRVA